MNYIIFLFHVENVLQVIAPFITCMLAAMDSLSVRSSAIFLVPRTFLSVVAANRRVDWYASDTFTVAMVASKILMKRTASTATVTESLVRI